MLTRATCPCSSRGFSIWKKAAGDAGLPLGGALAGWRKITVGDRDWRIIYRMNADEAVATVWVIGDRADAACYEEAQQRVQALGKGRPEAQSLAATMLALSELQRQRRERRHGRRRR